MDQNSSYPKKEKSIVLEPEIIEPGDSGQNRGGQRTTYRAYYSGPAGGSFWTVGNIYSGGCFGPGITLGLFLLALVQYGLLAAIGFMFFYAIGSVWGTIYQAKKLVEGIVTNPWGWRIWNWVISFLLTVWLAGGFHD